ncbi:MAG: hypothetical protein ACI8T1_004713 [Verrucomicrobiales bacterium]|jgi:hypothetical protein
MAKRLGDEAIYKVFYGKYSQVTHGLSMDQQMIFEGNQVTFDHIRTLGSIDEAFQMSTSYAMSIYRSTLTKFRPGEIEAFNSKCLTEWRKPFRLIPKVTRNGSSYVIAQQRSWAPFSFGNRGRHDRKIFRVTPLPKAVSCFLAACRAPR